MSDEISSGINLSTDKSMSVAEILAMAKTMYQELKMSTSNLQEQYAVMSVLTTLVNYGAATNNGH